MVIPSTPAAPRLAFTRSHACCRFSGLRIRSNRSVEEVPCSSCNSRCAETRPVGFVVPGKAAAVEPLLTSSGLGEGPTSLLCPRLTPVPARRSLLAAAPAVADGLGLQASLSKDVNSCCTTGPFISGAEHWAALCRATPLFPAPSIGRGFTRIQWTRERGTAAQARKSGAAPSTLYGLSVRRPALSGFGVVHPHQA